MQFQWAMRNYYSMVMRTITLHTIHVGALENYTKSNNLNKVVNRTLIGNRGHGKKKCNYSGTPLMRPPLGHKILVVITRWSH